MGDRKTLVGCIEHWANDVPDRPALYGRSASGEWQHRTWSEYWTDVRAVGKALVDLGVDPGECVGIVGANRPEWVLAEFGMIACGSIPAPIYTTNTVDQVAFILAHSQCKVAFCDDQEQLDKYLACREKKGVQVTTIVTMDPIECDDDGVITFDELLETGKALSDDPLDERLNDLKEDQTALLIYTSGTTGVPKAVQITHMGARMMGHELASMVSDLEYSDYCSLSYLPLCHIAEQLFTNFMHLETGGAVYFCPDLKKLKDYLPEVRPNVFVGVPRVWEKFEAALGAKFAEASPIKKMLLGWARKKELQAFKKEVATGQPVDTFARRMANNVVLSKLKGLLGLDQIEIAGSGAAPISTRTLEFFASLGLIIHEGYGMSETSGLATVNEYKRPRFGTVGKLMNGVEVRFADDGEIQLKGINMTPGYLRQPKQTAELFAEDGWLCTGDLGEMDDAGNLKITGRKKDLIITAGGKNVAPAEIEAYLKQIPGVGQAVVVGDRQPYLCAIIVLDAEGLGEFCNLLGIEAATIADAVADPKVRAYFEERIESQCNTNVARYQTIKKFEVLPLEFTVEGGEMTPTMKIKRNIVNEKYADTIAAFYS